MAFPAMLPKKINSQIDLIKKCVFWENTELVPRDDGKINAIRIN